MHRQLPLRALFALFTLASAASAQERRAPAFADTLRTVAGELKVVELEQSCKYEVRLNGGIVFRTDCTDEASEYSATPIPHVHTHFKSIYEGIRPYDEVVLFQLGMLGNACEGGPLVFLGIREGGSYSLSKRIDFCGGRQPVITWGNDRVLVLIPGGPPNRGGGYIPPETWVYERGAVRKMPSARRRK